MQKEPTVSKNSSTAHIIAQTFTFRELAAATKNFRPESLLGKEKFGRVYKGRLKSTGQVVAVKQLNQNGLQGNREFLVEVLMLSLLHHPNLIKLFGYCADGDQRLLIIYVVGFIGGSFKRLVAQNPHKVAVHIRLYLNTAGFGRKGMDAKTLVSLSSSSSYNLLVYVLSATMVETMLIQECQIAEDDLNCRCVN